MTLFNWFKKKDTQIKEVTEINQESIPVNYDGLIEVTEILTENDSAAVASITKLVKEPNEFEHSFDSWLLEYDFSVTTDPDIITAYLLTGYNADSPYDFGGYIDWKEELSEIIASLNPSITNKNYPLDLKDITFSGEEFTYEVLTKISVFLNKNNFSLFNWDIGGDCYNLFIVPKKNWARLQKLGKEMNIRFTSVW